MIPFYIYSDPCKPCVCYQFEISNRKKHPFFGDAANLLI